MAGEPLRLFVALELPEPVREVLTSWARRVAEQAGNGVRVVPPESLHATLCFLGALPPERVDRVIEACEAVRGAEVGHLEAGRGLWLPSRRPRVLAVELDDPEGRLSGVQGELAAALSGAGLFRPATRPFLAHVTVARVGRDARPKVVRLPAAPAAGFPAERVVLYRSHLGRGPARYEALHEVPLSRG